MKSAGSPGPWWEHNPSQVRIANQRLGRSQGTGLGSQTRVTGLRVEAFKGLVEPSDAAAA